MSEEKRIKRQIEKELRKNTELDFDVFCFDLIDSTNTEARRYALSGGSAPAVFIAKEQSAGRGRMGRSFYSPKATGLYLSVLLDIQSDDAVRLTTSAAVAARRAVLRTTNTDLKIKWVNDLYLLDKKIAGILAESIFADGHRLTVLGVGINLCTDFGSTELEGIAGSLGTSEDIRIPLAVALVCELCSVLFREPPADVINEYKENSCVIGKPVVFTENNNEFYGKAIDITEQGHLRVLLNDGQEKILSSGEISLRVRNGEN